MNMIFKNKYNEIRSGWAIICGILFYLIVDIGSGQVVKLAQPTLRRILSCFVGILISFGLLYIIKLFYKKSYNAMGFTEENRFKSVAYGALFGFVSITLTFFVLVVTNNVTVLDVNITNIFSLNLFLSFLACVITGLTEETLFRSYIMTALQTTRSKLAIIMISSALFSIAHGANPGMGFLPFMNIILAGFVFGYLFIKSGNVWLPIGYHAIWNFFEGPFYGLLLSGSKASETVITVSTSGRDFITGGSFGPEGGVVVTVVLVLNFLWLYFFVKTTKTNEGWHISGN